MPITVIRQKTKLRKGLGGMKEKNYQESNFASERNLKNKTASPKKGMPTIRCVCGTRILLIPDLKAMNRAIKNHLAKHKQVDYGLMPELLKFLTEQILIVASEMNLPNVS
jgi:hypothetical protein